MGSDGGCCSLTLTFLPEKLSVSARCRMEPWEELSR